jgi:hypothetical protein
VTLPALVDAEDEALKARRAEAPELFRQILGRPESDDFGA